MLARRSAVETVGGFDERYFLYWEDADLCRRLRARGYTTRYVPGGRVMHVGGRSSRSARGAAIRAFHRSAFTYYATHVARGPLTRAIAWLLLTGRCQWKLLASRVVRES
jgi:GT2 family glycosyltransferase